MRAHESLYRRVGRALSLGRAVRLVWTAAPRLTTSTLALIVIQSALPLASLYLMKLIVDAIASAVSSGEGTAALHDTLVLVAAWGAVALAGTLCHLLQGLISEAQSQVVTDYMHGILHAKSVEVDLHYYEDSQYYDTLHRAQQEAPYRPSRIVNGLVKTTQNTVSLLAIGVLLFALHWVVAAILLLACIPGVVVRLAYVNEMYDWQCRRTAVERESWYYDWMLTRDTHAKEIRLFDLGMLFMDRFRRLRKTLREERLLISRKRSVRELATQVSSLAAMLISFVFVAHQALGGGLSLGDVVMYYQAFQRALQFLQDVLNGLAGLYEDNLFLSSMYEFLDLKTRVVQPSEPLPIPRPLRTGLVFDNVSFRYPGSSRTVLDRVDMEVGPGEVVALVGENGSGKTTLAKLLCRLYDPDDGAISIDGTDLRRLDLKALRREIGVIFQDYAHYNVTAWENIWFGNADLDPDQEQIIAAARRSGAHDVIVGLPQGYKTLLGKWFENGEELSIGEWQKVALARAFLRRSPIIVLDEPTSAMDASAEYEFFRRFRELARGCSVILISHRFSSVRMADRIYVLESGRITEHGTHDQLMSRRGMYSRLFDRQACHYR